MKTNIWLLFLNDFDLRNIGLTVLDRANILDNVQCSSKYVFIAAGSDVLITF